MTIDFDDLKGCPLAKLNIHIHMCIYVYNWVVQKKMVTIGQWFGEARIT